MIVAVIPTWRNCRVGLMKFPDCVRLLTMLLTSWQSWHVAYWGELSVYPSLDGIMPIVCKFNLFCDIFWSSTRGAALTTEEELLPIWEKFSNGLKDCLGSVVLPIGSLSIGLCRHRALLFKVCKQCYFLTHVDINFIIESCMEIVVTSFPSFLCRIIWWFFYYAIMSHFVPTKYTLKFSLIRIAIFNLRLYSKKKRRGGVMSLDESMRLFICIPIIVSCNVIFFGISCLLDPHSTWLEGFFVFSNPKSCSKTVAMPYWAQFCFIWWP